MEKYITLGILGGGQLGRMSSMAAANLGIRSHIYCPEQNCPASQVTDLFTCADYENFEALHQFAKSVDIVTYEFENIPLKVIDFLKEYKPVYPNQNLLEISQNRLIEKEFLNDLGIMTVQWASATKAQDIEDTLSLWKAQECIIKTTRLGYDGKGQLKHNVDNNSLISWSRLNTQEAVIESIVDFAYEASIIIARDAFGTIETFPMTRNDHRNHILSRSTAPSGMTAAMERQAGEIAHTVAEAVNLRGLLTIEFFVTKDGNLIANEIAPRTHNSGHWTMDGCSISQFEQHVRAVCGLPILKPVMREPTVMINLIGDDIERVPDYLKMPNARVHLYGKLEDRPGRKMGHVNLLNPTQQQLDDEDENCQEKR